MSFDSRSANLVLKSQNWLFSAIKCSFYFNQWKYDLGNLAPADFESNFKPRFECKTFRFTGVNQYPMEKKSRSPFFVGALNTCLVGHHFFAVLLFVVPREMEVDSEGQPWIGTGLQPHFDPQVVQRCWQSFYGRVGHKKPS